MAQRDTREEFFKEMNKMVAAYEKAVEIQNEYKHGKRGEYDSADQAMIACSQDYQWRIAVADQQFAERLANLYGNATMLATLDSIRTELMELNDKLTNPSRTYKPPRPWQRPDVSDWHM